MNKQDVKIKVYAYSTFADGLITPNFESVHCDGENSPCHFISGYGKIEECGANTQMLKGSHVAFCGFANQNIAEYATTNINNIVQLRQSITTSYAYTGYIAYLINVIKSLQISIGDTVLVNVKQTIQPIIEFLIDFCGAKSVSARNADSTIEKVICDDINEALLEQISDYAHIAHLGHIDTVPTIKHQQIICISNIGDLSDIVDYAANGRTFPKHYTLNSFSKNIATAILAINKADCQGSHIFDSLDIHKLYDGSQNDPTIDSDSKKNEFNPHVSTLQSLFAEHIDSGLINIMVSSDDINKSLEESLKLAKYIVDDESVTFSVEKTHSYINATAQLAQGTTIHCVIVNSKLSKTRIEIHFDGQSIVSDLEHCELYQQTKSAII
ncbi:MAG: hypothetical protein IJA66_03690 [Alistipes sp.]|nr:hypothetical protein [Alistipes sp.]